VGYTVFRCDATDFTPPSAGDQTRGIVRLSEALTSMRANVWLMPPRTRGRRHVELVQEELFAALSGTATLFLGDPAEAVELAAGSLVVVEPGTAVQLANEHAHEARVLIVGAPPVHGQASYLPDASLEQAPHSV
jgi:mannose-6-phosphate isomerase-like protein (cupin superfamily)